MVSQTLKQQLQPSANNVLADNWVVIQQLGKGSFGIVYEAENVSTKKRCALKVIDKTTLKEKDKQLVDFECKTQAKLNHPRIVKLEEVVESPDKVYMALELVKGKNLFDYLSEKAARGLDERHAQLLFWQMANAVAYCHHQGIAHRDIKLENFLVSSSGAKVKLIDFGLCDKFDPVTRLLTTTCGSPLYAPPEIIFGKKHDATRADVWSLGITLFAILTKRMPFLNSQGQLVVDRALSGISSSLPRSLSPEACDLLECMIEPDNKQRISSSELLRHPWVLEGKAIYETFFKHQISCDSVKVKGSFTPLAVHNEISMEHEVTSTKSETELSQSQSRGSRRTRKGLPNIFDLLKFSVSKMKQAKNK